MVDFYGKLVGKYTIPPMVPMGKNAKTPQSSGHF